MTNEQAYERGVTDVVALMDATAARLKASDLQLLRRELAIETLRAVAAEARALIDPAAVEATSGLDKKPQNTHGESPDRGVFDQAGNVL